MIWLGIYLFTGVVGFIVVAQVARRRNQNVDSFSAVFSLDITGLFIIFFWPIFLVWAWFDSKIPAPEVEVPYSIPSPEITDLIGKNGIVTKELRPGGEVRIGDSNYDALSLDAVIDVGEQVEVVAQDCLSVKVRKM